MAITTRHTFGWKCEQILHPILEELTGDRLIKTASRYDSIDFVGDKYIIELKSRPRYSEKGVYQPSSKYSEWLIPTCKAKTNTTGKRLVFFYYWEADNSLWCCFYKDKKFHQVHKSIPFFHTEEHFWIPSDFFTKMEVQVPAEQIAVSSS
jgi:hypothetical protein